MYLEYFFDEAIRLVDNIPFYVMLFYWTELFFL